VFHGKILGRESHLGALERFVNLTDECRIIKDRSIIRHRVLEALVGRAGQGDEVVGRLAHGAVNEILGQHHLASHIASAHLRAVALEHGHVEALLDRCFPDNLPEPDHALAPKAARHDFDSILHSLPVLLILSTESRTSWENSGLELLASCHTPVAQMVPAFSFPKGAAWDLIHR